MLRDLNISVSGRRNSTDPRSGVLASDIPTGHLLPSFLLNDIDSEFPNRLYSLEILTQPLLGILTLNKAGAGTFSGAPNGNYSGNQKVRKFDPGIGMVSSADTTYSFQIGAVVATVTSVVVTPSSVSVAGGSTQQFNHVVNGANSPSQSVTWVKTGGGTLSPSGLFTAPAATGVAQTITVTATSTLDSTKSGSATITIPAFILPTVSLVEISPVNPVIEGGDTQQFVATVVGTNFPSQGVTWSVTGGGNISSAGLFTAPLATSEVQQIGVIATSIQDPSKIGASTVTIPALVVTPSVYPLPNTVLLGTQYGPTGVEFTGTMVPSVGGGSGATAQEIANAVWAHQTALSIPEFLGLK